MPIVNINRIKKPKICSFSYFLEIKIIEKIAKENQEKVKINQKYSNESNGNIIAGGYPITFKKFMFELNIIDGDE
ncbi:MAG: hypothetical protein QXU98_07780 [Candidatus Parvarchaeota archaeon]